MNPKININDFLQMGEIKAFLTRESLERYQKEQMEKVVNLEKQNLQEVLVKREEKLPQKQFKL